MARFFLALKKGGDIRVRSLIREEGPPAIHAPFKALIPQDAAFLGLPYERLVALAQSPGWVDTREDGSVIEP